MYLILSQTMEKAIGLTLKVVTDQHKYATLTNVNTRTDNSISDQYRTRKTRTLINQHASNWTESVLWMGVFCYMVHISDPGIFSLLYDCRLQEYCILRKCQMYGCLSPEVKNVHPSVYYLFGVMLTPIDDVRDFLYLYVSLCFQ